MLDIGTKGYIVQNDEIYDARVYKQQITTTYSEDGNEEKEIIYKIKMKVNDEEIDTWRKEEHFYEEIADIDEGMLQAAIENMEQAEEKIENKLEEVKRDKKVAKETLEKIQSE